MSVGSQFGGTILCGLIRAYQVVVSPLLGPRCRFHPSCSVYAAEAIGRHGAAAGGWLALRRIGRCHPWGGWGFDPVPDNVLAAQPGQLGSAGPGHMPCSHPSCHPTP